MTVWCVAGWVDRIPRYSPIPHTHTHPSVDCRDKIINYFVKLKTYKIIIFEMHLAEVRKPVDFDVHAPSKRQRDIHPTETLVKLTES